jgi:hypothetical protein
MYSNISVREIGYSRVRRHEQIWSDKQTTKPTDKEEERKLEREKGRRDWWGGKRKRDANREVHKYSERDREAERQTKR